MTRREMPINARPYGSGLGLTFLILFCVVLMGSMGAAAVEDVPRFPILASKDDPLYYYLAWPDMAKLPVVRDIILPEYSCEALVQRQLCNAG